MFNSYELLVKKSGKKGIDRPQHLKELVEEFNATEDKDCQEQILANLANFAYDPINYDWLLDLKVVDLFLHHLSEKSLIIQNFAIAGICNIAVDPRSKAVITRKNGIPLVSSLLFSLSDDCVINAITTLIFLCDRATKREIFSQPTISQMIELSNSRNPRIKNLASIFLSEHCLANILSE